MRLITTVSQYDPITVDTSYVEEASSKIPKGGHIDINEAEQLATVFLEAADKVTDEIARCSAFVGYCEAERRDKKATAIDDRIAGGNGTKGVAGTIAVQLFGNDPRYKAAHEKQAVGEAFLDWLRTKYKNLMAAHVLCKDIMKIHFAGREQGNWRGANPHNIDEEGEYDLSSGGGVTSSDEKGASFGAQDW